MDEGCNVFRDGGRRADLVLKLLPVVRAFISER
jgi:hypothetical protein